MSWCLLSLFRGKLDHIIDPEDCYGCFCCKSVGIYLRNHWLEHSCFQVVAWLAQNEIQTAETQFKLLWISLTFLLRGCVECPQLRNEFSCVFGCINWKCFWNDLESLTEFWDGDLLFAGVVLAKLIEVDAQSHINCSSSGNDFSRFESPLCNANCIMEWSKFT